MSGFLAEMARERLEQVRRDSGATPFAEIRDLAERRRGDKRPLDRALRRGPGDPVRAVAEVKRASPSAGVLRAEYDPASLARDYADWGASAISVLTEPGRFLGSMGDLARVREAVAVPVLMKDFVVHERLLYEGAARGADAALLIVALLDGGQLRDYAAVALDLGMTPLVEIHEPEEIDAAIGVPGVLGVNNRDLRTLAMRRGHAESLLPRLPGDRVRVAESGYGAREEIEAAGRAGADAVLVGESLLRAPSPRDAFRALFGDRSGPDAGRRASPKETR